jgi:NTP pyrophosphatase (non-canonical NTP hydrolase)
MEEQRRVAAFVDEHDLATPPEFRLLDLVSELGEVAKNATESTDYGGDPDGLALDADEVGDVLFALLALAESVEIDAGAALDESLAKYERRLEADGTPASGE